MNDLKMSFFEAFIYWLPTLERVGWIPTRLSPVVRRGGLKPVSIFFSPRPCTKTRDFYSTQSNHKTSLHTSLFLFLVLFISMGLHSQKPMTTNEAKSLQALVKQKAEATKTVTSDFVQYKHLDFLSNDIKSEGKLAFKTPNLVKWEYVAPFSYAILFKNQTLYIDDDGNKSNMDMGGNELFKQLNQLITASIRGDLFDTAQFDISYFKQDRKYLVHFMPKDAQFTEFIKAFHILFANDGTVEEVKMIEPSEDYTQIVFENRIENQPLSDAVFAQ